jgi:hypothetical protein
LQFRYRDLCRPPPLSSTQAVLLWCRPATYRRRTGPSGVVLSALIEDPDRKAGAIGNES